MGPCASKAEAVLWTAIRTGDIEAVKKYIHSGGNVNICGTMSNTVSAVSLRVSPLVYVFQSSIALSHQEQKTDTYGTLVERRKEIACILVQSGAADMTSVDCNGASVLEIALMYHGGLALIRNMIDAGADVNARLSHITARWDGDTILHNVVQFKNQTYDSGTTLSLSAIATQYLDILLSSANIDVNCTNALGITPLMLAATNTEPHALQMLLDFQSETETGTGVSTNADIDTVKGKKAKVLECDSHCDCKGKEVEAAAVNIHARDQAGNTALIYAAEAGSGCEHNVCTLLAGARRRIEPGPAGTVTAAAAAAEAARLSMNDFVNAVRYDTGWTALMFVLSNIAVLNTAFNKHRPRVRVAVTTVRDSVSVVRHTVSDNHSSTHRDSDIATDSMAAASEADMLAAAIATATKAVHVLLDYNADVNTIEVSDACNSVLGFAVQSQCNLGIVKRLVLCGADMFYRNAQGHTIPALAQLSYTTQTEYQNQHTTQSECRSDDHKQSDSMTCHAMVIDDSESDDDGGELVNYIMYAYAVRQLAIVFPSRTGSALVKPALVKQCDRVHDNDMPLGLTDTVTDTAVAVAATESDAAVCESSSSSSRSTSCAVWNAMCSDLFDWNIPVHHILPYLAVKMKR
jgi:ankyrin repeat protein